MRKHVEQGSRAGLKPALGLGRKAVPLGLETLPLARIHEQALATLVLPDGSSRTRQRMGKRARSFFAETLVPIEKTHRAALKADACLHRLTRTLRQRSAESALSIRRLKESSIQRQGAELALRTSGKRHARLRTELHGLQKHLQHVARGILSAQEDERRKTSHQLHDEIAQALIAINLRLLTLKKAARVSTASLKKEIASTQRLVRESVKRVEQFAHEFGIQQHET